MARFLNERVQPDGSVQFFYSIAGEDPASIAYNLQSAAPGGQVAISAQLPGSQTTVSARPEQIEDLVQQGAKVAAVVSASGNTTFVHFAHDKVVVIPQNRSRDVADQLMGTAYDDFGDFGGGYDDYGSSSGAPLAMHPDPRGTRRGPSQPIDDYPSDSEVNNEPVGIGEWLLTFILLSIPIVGLVFFIIWMVSKKTKKSKKNFLITYLIIWLIGLLLTAGSIFLFGAQLKEMIQKYNAASNANVTMTTNSNTNGNSNNNNIIENIEDNSNYTNTNNGNANGNANNENNSNNTVAPPVVEQPAVPSAEVHIDYMTVSNLPDGRRVAIVTATAHNMGPIAFTPSTAFQTSANQGITQLAPNFDPVQGFDPATINFEVPANNAWSYQFSYFIADDQPIHILIQNTQTQATLAEADFPVV